MDTTKMGDDPNKSVVGSDTRAHQDRSLFLAGSGEFPRGGTAISTLTIVALSLRLTDSIVKQSKN